MSTNGQQVLNWAEGLLGRADCTVDDKSVTTEPEPSCRCSTCHAVIGTAQQQVWHYCMEGTLQ